MYWLLAGNRERGYPFCSMDEAISLDAGRRTKRALFFSSLLHEPLFTLYSLVSFFLVKDMGATALQITLFTMLKPVSTILSFYWSSWSRARLRANVLWAGILMRAPFLFVPWIDSVWFIIAACVNYMFFYRAGMPAWMEILKRNMPAGAREKAFSWSSTASHIEGAIIAIAMGALLDQDPAEIKLLFVAASLLGILGTLAQVRVPVVECAKEARPPLGELIARPWRDSWNLMRKRKDFAKFQWGFMVCGFALMLMQPALPIFMVDELGISYKQVAVAIMVAKAFGFAASSPLWTRWMARISMQRLSCAVFLTMAFFPLFMGMATKDLFWFFAAYFIYGVGQGGSHLVWSMSGPHFAGKEESSRYTGVGVVLAGMRGAVAPPLGGLMLGGWGAIPVMGISALLFLWSGLGIFKSSKKSLASN